MSLLESIIEASTDSNTVLVEDQYIDLHPDQAGDILGYLDRVSDPDKFREVIQKALDEEKVIAFAYPKEVFIDQLPEYTLSNATTTSE